MLQIVKKFLNPFDSKEVSKAPDMIVDMFLKEIRQNGTQRKWSFIFAESLYEHFISQQDTLNVIADKEGYFVAVNNEWLETFGFTLDEITSRPFTSFIHPDDIERTLGVYEEVQSDAGKFSKDLINRYKTKNGDYIWLHWKPNSTIGKQDLKYIIGSATPLSSSQVQDLTLSR